MRSLENRESLDKILVVTNNRILAEQGKYPVDFVEVTPVDVLVRVILLLQSGYRFVSAPLPPGVSAMRAPFRSFLLEKSDEKYDIAGIEVVEKTRKAMVKQRMIGGAQDEVERDALDKVEDFALIDGECLERAVRDYLLIAGDLDKED